MASHGFDYVGSAIGAAKAASDPAEFALQAMMALEERAASLATPLEPADYPAPMVEVGDRAFSGAFGDVGVAVQVNSQTMQTLVDCLERAVRRGDAVLARLLVGMSHAHLQAAKTSGARSIRAITMQPMKQGEADRSKPKLGADMLLPRSSCPQDWQKSTVWFSALVAANTKTDQGKAKAKSQAARVPVKV